MAGEVSFKAYLSKEGDAKPEVRRFSLDENVATSFIYLKEKLRSLFTPLVISPSFDIHWKGKSKAIGTLNLNPHNPDENLVLVSSFHKNINVY